MDMISNGCFPGEPAFPPHTTNRTESTEILLHRRFDGNAVCSNTEDPSMVSNKKGMSSSNLVAVDAAKKNTKKQVFEHNDLCMIEVTLCFNKNTHQIDDIGPRCFFCESSNCTVSTKWIIT